MFTRNDLNEIQGAVQIRQSLQAIRTSGVGIHSGHDYANGTSLSEADAKEITSTDPAHHRFHDPSTTITNTSTTNPSYLDSPTRYQFAFFTGVLKLISRFMNPTVFFVSLALLGLLFIFINFFMVIRSL